MNKTRLGALAPLILALAACGGGSGDGPAVFPPGEVLTFAATLDDGSTQETRYLVHAVTADGDLVAGESTAKLSPHRPPLASVRVALPLEAGDTPQDNAARLAALRDFYKQLWQGIAERRNDGSDIAAEIGAFESDVGVLYDDYQQSELASVKDYVAFYEQVGENPYFDAQESVEEELVQFFSQTGWSQGAWLRALQRQNLDWPRFLNLMAQRENTFADLLGKYQRWSLSGGQGMEAFITHYVAGADLKKMNSEGPHTALGSQPKASTVKDSGAGKFAVSKTSWGIPIQSWYHSSVDILSREDTNPSHYQWLFDNQIVCPTRLTISGRLGRVSTDLQWAMKYTAVQHTSLPGRWIMGFGISSFNILDKYGHPIDESDGALGALEHLLVSGLSASMQIRDLKNVGTDAAPRPGFTARVKVTPSILFNSPWVRDCKVG